MTALRLVFAALFTLCIGLATTDAGETTKKGDKKGKGKQDTKLTGVYEKKVSPVPDLNMVLRMDFSKADQLKMSMSIGSEDKSEVESKYTAKDGKVSAEVTKVTNSGKAKGGPKIGEVFTFKYEQKGTDLIVSDFTTDDDKGGMMKELISGPFKSVKGK